MTDKQPDALEMATELEEDGRWRHANLIRTQHAEIERLNACIKWEQSRAERIGTHGPGCEKWGSAHFECALRAIERKDALLRQCLDALETDDWLKKLNASGAITKELSQ